MKIEKKNFKKREFINKFCIGYIQIKHLNFFKLLSLVINFSK